MHSYKMRPVQEYKKESKGYTVIEIKYEPATFPLQEH